MSYASALRGQSDQQKPTPEKVPKGKQVADGSQSADQKNAAKQPNAKSQAKPASNATRPEGNGVGAFNVLPLVVPKDQTQKGQKGQKKRGPRPLTLRALMIRLGRPSAYGLGRTCQTFASELREIKHVFDPHADWQKASANAKHQQNTEFIAALSFASEEITAEELQAAKEQAKFLNEEHAKLKAQRAEQKQKEYIERKEAEKEAADKEKGLKKKKTAEPEKAEKKTIIKKKTEETSDGFKAEVTEVYDAVDKRLLKKIAKSFDSKTGNVSSTVTVYEADGTSTTVEERENPKQNKKVIKIVNTASAQVSKTLLAANPFSAVMKAETIETPAEVLAKAQQGKAAGMSKKQQQEVEKQTKAAQNKANQQAKAAAAKAAGQQESAKQKAAREAKEAEEKKVQQQKERAEAQRQEQAKKEAQKKAQAAQPKAPKKAVAIAKKKPEENFQPIIIGLGLLVVFLAFGYAFSLQ